jgi:hypothetical protein
MDRSDVCAVGARSAVVAPFDGHDRDHHKPLEKLTVLRPTVLTCSFCPTVCGTREQVYAIEVEYELKDPHAGKCRVLTLCWCIFPGC